MREGLIPELVLSSNNSYDQWEEKLIKKKIDNIKEDYLKEK